MDIKLTEVLGKKEGEIFTLKGICCFYDFKIENNRLAFYDESTSDWTYHVNINWFLSLEELKGGYTLALIDELGDFLGLKNETDRCLLQNTKTGEFSFGNVHKWQACKTDFKYSYLKNLLEENPTLKDITYIKPVIKF